MLRFFIIICSCFLIPFAATALDPQWIKEIDSAILKEHVSYGSYALIAGGSKGIGYGIAKALARRNYNLVLVARGMDSLIAAKNNLERDYKIQVEILQYDLSKEESADEIMHWCYERKLPLKILCNVAGLGGTDDYLTLPVDTLRYMVHLNLESPAVLIYKLLPLLEANAPSHIMNVCSMAAFAPIPDNNLYSATKSALLFFSYALRYQLKEKNISVSALCPGPVYTKPEVVKDTRDNLGWFGDQIALTAERTGEVAVRRTLRGRTVIVPGTLANISSWFIRLMPLKWMTALYGKAGKRSFEKQSRKSSHSAEKL
jgi:uncharacterized protein